MLYDISKLPLPEDAGQNLARQIESGRLSHAVMFTGGQEKDRRASALWLCQALFCKNGKKRPCGKCEACRRIKAGSYPDVRTVPRDDKKKEAVYNVEVLRSELVAKSNQKPVSEPYQIFLLYEMSGIGEIQQDTLLKVLEDPAAVSKVVMTARSPADFRETIRSRVTVFSAGAAGNRTSDKALQKYDGTACDILAAVASKSEYNILIALGRIGDRRQNGGVLERMGELVRDALSLKNGAAAVYADPDERSGKAAEGLAKRLSAEELFEISAVINDGLRYTDGSMNQNLFLTLMTVKLSEVFQERIR